MTATTLSGRGSGAGGNSHLRTRGTEFLDGNGEPVRLRGVGLGGWLNMENFITGYPANESMMRSAVRRVLGPEKYDLFFERLLTAFFDADDARLLADTGLNSIRLPVNYRHFEDDARPFQIKQEGFRHLDRVINLCAAHGIYPIIDLHALPGYQNHHWHSDNPTHLPGFWDHPHFQDRVVHLWEAFADRYKDNVRVGGYNLINEPADESRAVVGPFYRRLVAAVRAVDPKHTLFLDGNTYSTEFDVFDDLWPGGPPENLVYVCHDYAGPGLGFGGPYPGRTQGAWFDADAVEQKFLLRTEYSRRTGTPIWVGEFGPIYTGDPGVDGQRRQLLDDQLDVYRRHNASWSIWTYKDVGAQGLATVRPDSPYGERFADFMARKRRLGADNWGSTGDGRREVTQPVQDMMASEFPGFEPYPFGRWEFVRTLLLNITVAQALVPEYAELFRGLDDSELLALADSFALANCSIREQLRMQLGKG
jgi:aryl-phospho-beta-D-glucosidase BglC (GH1 family)